MTRKNSKSQVRQVTLGAILKKNIVSIEQVDTVFDGFLMQATLAEINENLENPISRPAFRALEKVMFGDLPFKLRPRLIYSRRMTVHWLGRQGGVIQVYRKNRVGRSVPLFKANSIDEIVAKIRAEKGPTAAFTVGQISQILSNIYRARRRHIKSLIRDLQKMKVREAGPAIRAFMRRRDLPTWNSEMAVLEAVYETARLAPK